MPWTVTSDAAINPKDVAGVWLFDENRGDVAEDAPSNGTLRGQHEIAYVDGVKLGEFDKAHAGTQPIRWKLVVVWGEVSRYSARWMR